MLESPSVRIERIISHGHASAEGFWYDQDDDEWVMMLRGTAAIRFGDGTLVDLGPGDHVHIPRHIRHRVERTSDDVVWLAVHLKAEPSPSGEKERRVIDPPNTDG